MEMVSGSGCDGAPVSEGAVRLSMWRSYGICIAAVEGPRRFLTIVVSALLATMLVLPVLPAAAQAPAAEAAKPVKVVVLGDSLTAGLGLPATAAFPLRLEKVLRGKGIETSMGNAGVSGDTT